MSLLAAAALVLTTLIQSRNRCPNHSSLVICQASLLLPSNNAYGVAPNYDFIIQNLSLHVLSNTKTQEGLGSIKHILALLLTGE